MAIGNFNVHPRLESAFNQSPLNVNELRDLLNGIYWTRTDTRFCMEICRKLHGQRGGEYFLLEWLRHARDLAADWRDQYLVMSFATFTLSDQDAAVRVYESKPWLKELGFDLEHGYETYCTHRDSMFLMSADGACDNKTLAVSATDPRTMNELVGAPRFLDGSTRTHFFLKPGTYSGSVLAGSGDVTITGIGGADQTIMELGEGEALFQSSYTMTLRGLTIRRVRGDGAELPAVAWRNLAVILVYDCVISNPGGAALGSIGEISEQVEISRCLIMDSRTGVDVQAMRFKIDDTRFEGIAETAIALRIHERWPTGQCSFSADRLPGN